MPLLPWLWSLRFAYVHLLLVGWTVQFACGVAFWILPRLDAGGDRGDERLIWLCYGSLNTGVILAAINDPLVAVIGATGVLWTLPVLGRLLYIVAITAFVIHAAARVVPFRRLPRAQS